jgi:pimeloyl-ACP methyl ester carboxylesterase
MVQSMRAYTLAVLVVGTLSACRQSRTSPSDSPGAWTDTSPHRSEYVTVNGVRLNYLDWGGTGPALVLIHGLTDSPHAFDDLAPSLRDRFHVIAYARRGHGHSDAPTGPYDQKTLVEDLRQLLDRLGIARTNLLGWSMGGNEITEFAGRYPDRVEGLVFLEAGYDWSDSKFQSEFPSLSPDTSALRSLDAYRTWYRQTWFGDIPWTPGLEAYLRDITRVDPDGSVHPVPSGSVLEAVSASNAHSSRDYGRVRAPALALYAASFLPMDPSVPAAMRVSQDWEDQVMTAFRRASIERVRRELSHVVVREFPNTNHLSILVLDQDALAAAIREFLGHAGRQ